MPARARLTRRIALRPGVLWLCGALLFGGCGAPPPQVPVGRAERVSAALTGIAEACGEAYQQGRPGSAPAATIEAAATMRAQELAQVFTDDLEGIYQGQTLRQVLARAITYLQECGLQRSAAALRSETRAR